MRKPELSSDASVTCGAIEVPKDNEPPPAGSGSRVGGKLRFLLVFPAVALVVLLAWGLERTTAKLDVGVLATALRATPVSGLVLATTATMLSYLALFGYDLSGLRYARVRLPLKTVLLASFCGFAVGNTIGLGALSGGAVRYRIYSTAGLSPGQIGRVVLFISAAFGVGLAIIAALGLVLHASEMGRLFGTSPAPLRWVAATILVLASLVLVFCAMRNAPLSLIGIDRPGVALVLTQLCLTAVDILSAAAALWVLLPPTGTSFFTFAAIYATALGLGIVSYIPGGLGVFEVVILYAFHGKVPVSAAAAALVTYRAIYFFMPLLVSLVLLAGFELSRSLAPATVRRIAGTAGDLVPRLLSATTFAVGATLIAYGAMPVFIDRLQLLDVAVPRSAVAVSHFLTGFVGLVLLIAARGLWRRTGGAWWLASSVMLLCIPISLIKGLGVFAPSVSIALIFGLLLVRGRFQHPVPEPAWRPSRGPLLALGCIAFATLWVFFLAFHDSAHAHELWWQIEFDGSAPRELRMMLGICVLALAGGAWRLIRPRAGRAAPPSPAEIKRARHIAETQPRSEAMLALMGDKSFLFSDSGSSFLMFATRGRTWAALGDPVGLPAEWPDLVGRFIVLADSHGGRAAFYQIPATSLPIYLDAGLRLLKLGEEARVPLPSFSLDGSRRAELRYARRRGERAGLRVEIIPPEHVGAVVDEIARISDAWLRRYGGEEKRFSVAAFRRDYVFSQPIALLRWNGEPVAFASVMTTHLKDEATIGLMRHMPDRTPPYAMEYLLTRTIELCRDEGYRSLSLGMVPLSGLRTGRLAPRWHRAGRIVQSLGTRFYNFQGLRTFKGKFHPAWEPRYLASSGVFGPYVALIDIAALIGTGRRAGPVVSRTAGGKRRRRRGVVALVLALAAGSAMCLPPPASAFDGGSLGNVRLVKPVGAERAFVVLFSGAGGWNWTTGRVAAAMARDGALVVGVDLPEYLKRLNARAWDTCHQPYGVIDVLSRQLQRDEGNAAYLTPIVAGIGEGGALAGAMLAQAPANTIAGAVVYNPTAIVKTSIPLCSTPAARPDPTGGFSYGPWRRLPGFLVAMLGSATDTQGRQYLTALKAAGTPVDIDNLAPDSDPASGFAAVLRRRLAQAAAEAENRIVSDLPLIELPAKRRGRLLAIVLSGDGGWRDLDKTIAEKLQSQGVDVVGWDSLRYFWDRKSPTRTARDLAAVIDAYSHRWKAAKVALIGYSFGADVLPIVYDRLPPEAKVKVVQLSLLGIATKAVFQFSFAGWLGEEPDKGALPTTPALKRIDPQMIQCFYGSEDKRESACPGLASNPKVAVIQTAGGHHFSYNYRPITMRILDGFRRRAG